MPSVSETAGVKTPLGASLEAGLETLSLDQTVRFTKYIRLILPLDGFVFWVRSDLVSPSAAFNTSIFNSVFYDEPPKPLSDVAVFDAKGSMHYTTDTLQLEDESYAQNTMTFTATEPVDDLNEVSPSVMYIGEFDGLQFVFSQRGAFYRQADLYHYRGDAIYPVLQSQIVNSPTDIDSRNVIVSNSLPAWLQLNRYLPMFPSYLVPDNMPAPYGVIDIPEDGVRALQMAPLIDSTGSHSQLVAERVKVTLYGLRNFNAMDWMDYVYQYTLDTDVLGIMNMPVLRDAKRNQNELGIIAQKKTVEFEVSYYQLRIREVARQLILSSIVGFTIADMPA